MGGGWRDGQVEVRQMEGWTDKRTGGQMNGRTDGEVEVGQVEGWIDRWVEVGQIDGWRFR